VSGFGVSVDSAGGVDESCVRAGKGTSAAPMSSRAKGNIGRWSRVRLRARRKAVLARRPAAIDANAPSGLKPRRTDMTRSEIAALLHACEKWNGMIRDGVVAHGQPIGLAVERISRKWKCSAGGRADTGPWAN
jgi:hypothetical protein